MVRFHICIPKWDSRIVPHPTKEMVYMAPSCGGDHQEALDRRGEPRSDWTIKKLELAVYMPHIHFFSPLVAPLEHITTKVDNTI